MKLIQLQGVSKIYGSGESRTVALDKVNLSIDQGEFVAIIGPSGSGKSTLMNILGLLDTPSEGSYGLEGSQVSSLSDAAVARLRREKIGFVFQSFNLLPRLSVQANVELPMTYAGLSPRERRARAEELLERVGLKGREQNRPNAISGGQAQRAAIARALANHPSLILADEPTGNLDTASSHAVIELLRELHRGGTTIILVTHNPEIAAVAGRTISVRDGRIESDTFNSGIGGITTRLKEKLKRGTKS